MISYLTQNINDRETHNFVNIFKIPLQNIDSWQLCYNASRFRNLIKPQDP